jgi:hypothetical protein
MKGTAAGGAPVAAAAGVADTTMSGSHERDEAT